MRAQARSADASNDERPPSGRLPQTRSLLPGHRNCAGRLAFRLEALQGVIWQAGKSTACDAVPSPTANKHLTSKAA